MISRLRSAKHPQRYRQTICLGARYTPPLRRIRLSCGVFVSLAQVHRWSEIFITEMRTSSWYRVIQSSANLAAEQVSGPPHSLLVTTLCAI
ncbi:hypothetical protein MRX96_015519 [Rhipicephalus microplus]